MRYIVLMSFLAFSISYANAFSKDAVCISKFGEENLCDYAAEIVANQTPKLPIRISPGLKIKSITSDKNVLIYHFVDSYTEVELRDLVQKKNSNWIDFKKSAISSFQNDKCISNDKSRVFIMNGGIISLEYKSVDGIVLLTHDIRECNSKYTAANNHQSVNETKRREVDANTIGLPQSAEEKIEASIYATAVANKYGQLRNIPYDENGQVNTNPASIQLVIDINGQLVGTIPNNATDLATKTAIRIARDASPYPAPPMMLLKGGTHAIVTIKSKAVKKTYTSTDLEYHQRN